MAEPRAAFAHGGTLVAGVGVNNQLAREQESRTCRATHPSFPGLTSWPEERAEAATPRSFLLWGARRPSANRNPMRRSR